MFEDRVMLYIKSFVYLTGSATRFYGTFKQILCHNMKINSSFGVWIVQ